MEQRERWSLLIRCLALLPLVKGAKTVFSEARRLGPELGPKAQSLAHDGGPMGPHESLFLHKILVSAVITLLTNQCKLPFFYNLLYQTLP